MAIEMSGGVYCPLSSHDPPNRLHALVQQTQNPLVLVHWLTKTKFQKNAVLVDIDKILINNIESKSDVDLNLLTNVMMTSENIACVIFTSGSTGTPKAVSSECFR
jgi:non-ribosomal peptide synthetase component F